MSYYQDLGKRLLIWTNKVYLNTASAFYPEISFGLQFQLELFKYSTAMIENDSVLFWQAFKNILCKVCEFVDNEPASDNAKKRKRMELDNLIPILYEISEKRPGAKKLATLLRKKRFPKRKSFYRAVKLL